ncbi:MAG: DUF1569 domain-containing protein [Planctomycetota bacterium]|jgi:hypothetical protein
MSSQPGDQRRILRFDDVSEVMPDVRRLVPAHHTLANWSLAQISAHLTHSFIGSMEGFDLSNHRVKRFFIKRRMLQVALTKGIPRGWTVDPNLTPRDEVDLNDAVDALDAAIRRYLDHRGKLYGHPLFGRMPRETWDRVHCVHSAHHLSFAIPARAGA